MRMVLFLERSSMLLIALLCIALLTTTAGTNVCVFVLLILAPWVWKNHQWPAGEWTLVKPLFVVISLFCLWDLVTNLLGGHSLVQSFEAMRHVRKFFFVLLLWPFFANARISKLAILTLFATVLVLAAANLVWTVLLDKNELMLSSMPNMHGQILVGISLMLIYRAIQVRQNAGLMWFAVAVLLCSLFFGSTRRTGYVLFLAGGLLLIVLSYRQHQYQKSKFFWACAGMLLALVLFTLLSSKFQHRMILIFSEYQEFFQLPEYERSKLSTSVGLRLQYLVSALQIVREHLFFGVGSITFKPLFWEVNHAMGATNPVIFAPNPHNEYLYTWATKGLVGIILYLAIFFQACRIAAKRMSTWQRHGMWLFVCIFLLSIMFNSMSIDMIEGHFMMLVLLSFLAPRHIWSSDVKENVSRK